MSSGSDGEGSSNQETQIDLRGSAHPAQFHIITILPDPSGVASLGASNHHSWGSDIVEVSCFHHPKEQNKNKTQPCPHIFISSRPTPLTLSCKTSHSHLSGYYQKIKMTRTKAAICSVEEGTKCSIKGVFIGRSPEIISILSFFKRSVH